MTEPSTKIVVGQEPSATGFLPPDEQRIATRGDIDKAERGLRREMRLLLVVGVASGNVLAALIAGYVARDTTTFNDAVALAGRLLGAG